jgi:opacity protein-like surface antigen
MARLSRLALIGLAAVLAGWARAADLPPIPSLPEAESGPAEFGGWYLRGDIGGGVNMTAPELRIAPDPIAAGLAGGFISSAATKTFNNATLSPSAMIDAGVGYQFDGWFRADATLEYRAGARLHSQYAARGPASASGVPSQYAEFDRGDVSSIVGLVNGYASPGSWYGLSPFVGAGVGFADNRTSGWTVETPLGATGYANRSRMSFAWALMAGVDYDLTSNLKLELGYRYLNYGSITTGGSNCGGTFFTAYCGSGVASAISSRNRLASSDFRLGLIYTIGGPPLAAAPE